MKKIVVLLAASIISCSAIAQSNNATAYGKKFEAKNVVNAEQVEVALLTEASGVAKTTVYDVTIEGELSEVCQAAGCWVKLKNPKGEDIFVKFNDHAFIVPKDLKASRVVAHGTLSRKEISVEEQKHLLEDAGASSAEIEAIKYPKQEVRMDADGIVVYK